jgi:hypothetical protein
MNPTPPAKLIWLIALLAFWAFYGLTGRDAWRAEEALALAPILDWLDGAVSFWSTPAPLYTLTAGIAIKLNLAGTDIQASARLLSGLFTVIALLFTGLSARALYGPGFGPAAAIALVGGLGLMLRAHALLPETALLAVWSVFLYGLIASRSSPFIGPLTLGITLPMLLLGLRGLPDLIAALAIMLLSLLSPDWRDRRYRQSLVRGLLLASGLIGLALAYLWQTGGLAAWLQWHGPERLIPQRWSAGVYSELPWIAWPLWPLALAAIWHVHRRLLRAGELHISLIAATVLLVSALAPAWSRDGALMPMLLPLALLAAFGVDSLRRGAAQAFYWFGVLFFGFLILAFWVYFSAMEWGYPIQLAQRMARLTPNYTPGSVEILAVVFAAGATLLWVIATTLFPRATIRPILVWATGMILVWTLWTALFRPWAEAGWAYRPLIAEMSKHLPAGACLNTQVDAAMQTMLRLHLNAPTHPDCAWTLTMLPRTAVANAANAENAENMDDAETARTTRVLLWEGFRPRSKAQIYRLEQHANQVD